MNLNDPYIPPPTVPPAAYAPGYTENFPAQPDPGYLVQPVISTVPTSQTSTTQPQTMPPNYIVLNLVVMLCSCCLFGLIGLYYSLEVEKEWKRGNHSGAFKASRVAKNWGIAGGVVGIISIIGSTIVSVIVPFILAVALRARALNEEH